MTSEDTGLVKKGVPLNEIIKTSATLDIIFFKGTGALSSGIAWFEKFRKRIVTGEPVYSHCAVIIKGRDIDYHNLDLVEVMDRENFQIDPSETYLLEAQMTSKSGQLLGDTKCHCGLAEYCTGCGTKCNFWGFTCEKIIYGVLFRKLSDVITDYDNDPEIQIGYGKLIKNPFRVASNTGEQVKNKHKVAITNCYINYRELPYDYGCCGINMFATVCRACRPCRLCITCGDTESAVVCSELVAMVYRDCGIIPANTATQNVSPMDFLGYEQDKYWFFRVFRVYREVFKRKYMVSIY